VNEAQQVVFQRDLHTNFAPLLTRTDTLSQANCVWGFSTTGHPIVTACKQLDPDEARLVYWPEAYVPPTQPAPRRPQNADVVVDWQSVPNARREMNPTADQGSSPTRPPDKRHGKR
jgi:hypothetical protein